MRRVAAFVVYNILAEPPFTLLGNVQAQKSPLTTKIQPCRTLSTSGRGTRMRRAAAATWPGTGTAPSGVQTSFWHSSHPTATRSMPARSVRFLGPDLVAASKLDQGGLRCIFRCPQAMPPALSRFKVQILRSACLDEPSRKHKDLGGCFW